MLGYKIAKSLGKRVVITLEIPEDAITNVKRSNIVNAETAKYRTMKAKVIKIEDSDGKTYNEAVSFNYKNSIKYKLDEELVSHDFDMNLEITCSTGIHFFLSKQMAETYGLVSIENGILTAWHNNGVKESEITFVNNNAQGISYQWYENGKNKCECTFLNGILHGLHTEWYENGNKQKESTFVNGKLDGLFTEWNEKGDKTREYNYGNKHDNEEQPAICCIIA